MTRPSCFPTPVRKVVAALVALILALPNPAPAQVPPGVARATPATAAFPTLGDGSDMGSANERRLGDRIAREIYRDPDYIDDPVLAEYVQEIWQSLLVAARSRGDLSAELDERFAWQVMLGRDHSINAFALPGGYLGVHLGLIAAVSNSDELASVLAHELSHVTQRHISRLISKQNQQTPWLLAAMILGALAGSKSADAGNALIVGGQAIAAQGQLNFSRDMEREADRVGLAVLSQAGFDAQGFVTMFDKLQQASRLNDNGAYPYLRSHPLTTERIADMQSRQMLLVRSAPQRALTPEHAMLAARARVLSNQGVDALRARTQEARGAQLPGEAAAQAGVFYAAALAASQLRDFAAARAQLTRLSALVRADVRASRLVDLLAAEVALAAADAPAAAAHSPTETAALRRPELLLQAQAALQTAARASAGSLAGLSAVAQRLQIWLLAHPHDALAWQLLSSVYAAQHQTLRAIRADAETQVARLDYVAALERFKAAQELARRGGGNADHIEASIIDTRRREVELLAKEQTLER